MDLKINKATTLSEPEIVDYVLSRFESLKKDLTKNKLVIFHTNNKFLLMSHSQEKLKVLGNIIANHQKNSIDESASDYESNLIKALSVSPTIKRHFNVLLHIFGHFSNDFDKTQEKTFLNLLERFKNGEIPLGMVLWEIDPLVYQYNKTYLLSQTYFLLYAEKRLWNI